MKVDVLAELMRYLGIERIAAAEYDGVRLPLFVIDEDRDWPWEPPRQIQTKSSIIAAIRAGRHELNLIGIELEIDGRTYRLTRYATGDFGDVAVWELETAMLARIRVSTSDAWDAWHFPRPWEGTREVSRLRGMRISA